MSELLQSQPWKSSNNGRKYSGHISVGNADVDSVGSSTAITGTASNNITNQMLTTDGTSTLVTGIFNNLLVTPSAPTSTTYAAQDGIIEVGAGNSSAMSGAIYGDVGAVYNYGSGALTGAAGVFGYVQNNGTAPITDSIGVRGGAIHQPSAPTTTTNHQSFSSLLINYGNSTITNQYGAKITAPINLGTITNNYGLYVESHTQGSTLNYNVYSAGSTAKNLFAGYTGIGAIDTSALATVDSTGSAITGLLVKSQTGQYLQKWQNSSGNDLTTMDSDGQVNLFASNQTYTAAKTLLKSNGTYTVDFANAFSPVAFDFNPTIIFKQNGFVFGSGAMFFGRPVIQNDSGSTRSMGPWLGFASNPTYQANGGTFSGQAIDMVAGATFNRINSGTTSFSNHYNFWAQGGTVDTGATVTNRYGFFYQDVGTINGTLTSSAAFTSNTLNGTNKTHFLMGTSTIPSGTWGIYQASTETNLLSGDLQFIKEAARTIQIQDTTTNNTAGAALSILAGKGKGSAAGGALNLTAGASDTAGLGGAVKVTAGLGTNLSKGGNVEILSGQGFTGGDVKIDVGSGFAGAKVLIGTVRSVPTGFVQGTPTALVHIGAGTATANTAPLKFTSGTNLTTAEAGAVEYDNTFYMTQSDATRRSVVLATNATKTTAGAPYTNDGYITVRIGGTDVKIMTTA